MWKFFHIVLFIQISLIHCLTGQVTIVSDNSADSYQVNCGHNYQSNCLIEATFSFSVLSNNTIDVLVNCSNLDIDAVRYNQFSSKIEVIIWNGCYAVNNLRYFGLGKISNRKDVKILRIERFTVETIESGTFDGFVQLKTLSFVSNSIEYLLSSCFKGLENLLMLQMTENNLKRLGSKTFHDLPKLNTLEIVDRSLLIANHQFNQHQTVENVAMDIYYIQIDIIESFFKHVRNLSVFSSEFNVQHEGTIKNDEMRMIGTGQEWIIESLRINGIKNCKILYFEDVQTLWNLELIKGNFNTVTLKNLNNLMNLSIVASHLTELPSFLGNFDQVESIDFSYNQLTTVSMSTFTKFPKLKKINFIHNNINILTDYQSTFNDIKILVNYNSLDCEWLASVVSKDIFTTFIYDKNFTIININGLQCWVASVKSVTLSLLSTQHPNIVTDEIHDENFNMKPEIFTFIICCSILLGIVITYIFIYTYNRILMFRQQPFYHMLRDSLIRPIYTARETLASDFKGIIFRNLPPTNYEHPVSTEKLDAEMNEMDENIYEEIPHKV